MTTHELTLTTDDVCNLPGEQRESRLALIRRELLPRASSTESLANGRAWEFPREPRLERQLKELVTFERVCCPGLGWELRPVRANTALRLEVTGLDPGASVLATVEPEAAPPRSGLRRFAGVGAVGFGVSLFFLCVLPMVLVAAGGAALAGTAARLDNPWLIGAGTLIFSLATWRVLGRRAAMRSDAPEPDCGC